MAKEFITKSYEKVLKDSEGNIRYDSTGKKITETVETKYRIDAEFVPQDIKEICFEFVKNYCKAQGKNGIVWFLKTTKEKVTNKKGELVAKSHSKIIAEFTQEYFSNLIKEKAKPVISSAIDEFEELLKEYE